MSTAIVKDGVIVNIIMASVKNAKDNLQAGETAVEAPFGLTLGDAINKAPEERPDPFDVEVSNFGPALRALFEQVSADNPGFEARIRARYSA